MGGESADEPTWAVILWIVSMAHAQMYDWSHLRTKGSHASFKKPGERTLPIPVHNGKVDQVYLEHVCRLLRLDDEEVK